VIADWATYKQVTGDTVTDEETANANLVRAQKRAEERTGRLFDRAEYTESLPIIGGKVWPSAYPVVSVTLPETAAVDGNALSISTGVADHYDVFEEVTQATGIPLVGDRSQLLVTYVGGYATGAAPVDLVEVICEMAQRYTMPANTVGVPAGATSVQVGGQSYSGNILGGASSLPLAIRNTLDRFRHVRLKMAD
jgi:hypothetical protein